MGKFQGGIIMSKSSISLIVCALLMCICTFVAAANRFQTKEEFIKRKVPKGHDFSKIAENAKYRAGHLLVRFTTRPDGKKRNIHDKKKILDILGGAKIKYNFNDEPGLTLVKLPPGQSIEEALKIYNAREDVLYAEPDYELNLFSSIPNDTLFDYLWGMHNTGQTGGTDDADINAPEAWDIISDANDIIVAVIDSGVDYTHPDLAFNMWINSIEEPNDANNDGYPGIQGVDDDGDGLIDEDSDDREPGDPNWTNDLFEDDDENGYANDIYGYDFS